VRALFIPARKEMEYHLLRKIIKGFLLISLSKMEGEQFRPFETKG
jgi:hypothetical protein